MTEARILVVTGLRREASIVAGPGIDAVLSGGHRPSLERRLAGLDPSGYAAVVSFGLAGALDPALPVGAVLVPDTVMSVLHPPLTPAQAGLQGEPDRIPASVGTSGIASHPISRTIAGAWRRRLSEAGIKPVGGWLLGVDRPLLTAADKALRRQATGAMAVDMESHVAAAFAARWSLPFGVLRVVSDGAGHDLPPIIGGLMRPDGGIDLGRLAAGLLRDPRQVAGLIATGREAGRAFRGLRRVRGLLDGRLGLDL